MIIVIDKRTGLVTMRCDTAPVVDDRYFLVIEKELTKEEQEWFVNNDTVRLENDKLEVFEKRTITKEPLSQEEILQVKKDLGEGKIEPIDAINKILDLISTQP